MNTVSTAAHTVPAIRRTLHIRRPAAKPAAPAPQPFEADEAQPFAPIVCRLDDVELAPQAAKAAEPSVDSATLLCGHKTVQIVHNGCVYKLQTTKLGKLILTK